MCTGIFLSSNDDIVSALEYRFAFLCICMPISICRVPEKQRVNWIQIYLNK